MNESIRHPDFVPGSPVKADKADDLLVIQHNLHLRLGVLNRFAPVGLALVSGNERQRYITQRDLQRFALALVMDFGDGLGIAQGGGTHGIGGRTGHVKT